MTKKQERAMRENREWCERQNAEDAKRQAAEKEARKRKAAGKEARKRKALEQEANPEICNGCTRYDGRYTRADRGIPAGPRCLHRKVLNGVAEVGKVPNGEEFKWGTEVLRPAWCKELRAKLLRSEKPDCWKCANRREVPGSAHTRCNNHSAKVEGHPQGIGNGWFGWPYNFDPTWLMACDGYSMKAKDKKAAMKRGTPIQELDGILGPHRL